MTTMATNSQVQIFADGRARPHCAIARALVGLFLDDIAAISGVYANLTASNPASTWTDSNPTATYSLQIADVLAINQFIHDVSGYITAHSAWPVVQEACQVPLGQSNIRIP